MIFPLHVPITSNEAGLFIISFLFILYSNSPFEEADHTAIELFLEEIVLLQPVLCFTLQDSVIVNPTETKVDAHCIFIMRSYKFIRNGLIAPLDVRLVNSNKVEFERKLQIPSIELDLQ